MQAAFPPDQYAELMRAQGLNVTEMRYGYKGRDAYKQFKRDVYDA